MHLLIYGINYSPELTGIGKYTTEMCEFLVDRGHDVTIASGFPYYPSWAIPDQYRNKYFLDETLNRVNVKRSFLYVPSKVTAKKRILHELSFIISSFFSLVTSKRPDILITISPPLGLGIIASIIAKARKVPFIFHVQDLQPDAAVDLGMIQKGILAGFLYKVEKFIYQNADLVSTISEGMRQKIISKGIDPEKVALFPNWVDTDFIRPFERDYSFRKKNNLGDKFIALYSGNIGMKQGLDTILSVAELTKQFKDILYLIVGDGAYKADLIKKHLNMRLSNVKFLPVQEKEVLPYMLSAGDVSLVPQMKSVTDIVMPSKLTGILSSGRAVIAGAHSGSEVYHVLKNNGCGIVVEPEDPKQMSEAIIRLYHNREEASEYGKKGRNYALKNLSKDAILKGFEMKLMEIVSKGNSSTLN